MEKRDLASQTTGGRMSTGGGTMSEREERERVVKDLRGDAEVIEDMVHRTKRDHVEMGVDGLRDLVETLTEAAALLSGEPDDEMVRVHPDYFVHLRSLERAAIRRGEASPTDWERTPPTSASDCGYKWVAGTGEHLCCEVQGHGAAHVCACGVVLEHAGTPPTSEREPKRVESGANCTCSWFSPGLSPSQRVLHGDCPVHAPPTSEREPLNEKVVHGEA